MTEQNREYPSWIFIHPQNGGVDGVMGMGMGGEGGGGEGGGLLGGNGCRKLLTEAGLPYLDIHP